MSAFDGLTAARISRNEGFSLLEVAIAGAILMGGLVIIAQLVRTTLSSSTPGFTEGVQVGPVVEQQLKLLGAYTKGYSTVRVTTVNRVRLGAVNIYANGTTGGYILPLTPGYGGSSYGLRVQDVTVRLTRTSDPTPDLALDPTVGFTRFWKLEVSPSANARTGL